MPNADERCWLCSFWSGSRCTNTWKLIIHAEPIGGQIEISTSPGMIPEELKPRFTEFFQKFFEKLIPAIEQFPLWAEIQEFQIAKDKTTRECPGRNERQDIKPFLHIVRTDI